MVQSSAVPAPTPSERAVTALSLHDRKLRLVRAQLAEIALTPLLERGFDAVTMDDLANAAGISRRTYFRYFATKEDVVTCVFDDAGDALLAEFERRPRTEHP